MSLTSYRAAPPRDKLCIWAPACAGVLFGFRLASLAGPHDGYEPDELPGCSTPRQFGENGKRGRPAPGLCSNRHGAWKARTRKPRKKPTRTRLSSTGHGTISYISRHERQARDTAGRGGGGGVARGGP